MLVFWITAATLPGACHTTGEHLLGHALIASHRTWHALRSGEENRTTLEPLCASPNCSVT
jgi:hypothetical protein